MNLEELEAGYEILDDIELDIDGKIKPALTGKIALIDADTLAYTACLSTEVQEDLLPIEMYTDTEYQAIISDPRYDPDTNAIWTLDVNLAYKKALEKLERIYDKTGCRECELHFTGGRDSFRYTVDTSYKANRSGRTPAGLQELKDKLMENFPSTLSTGWEADDIVVYKLKISNDILRAEKAELLMIDNTRRIGSDSGAKYTHNSSYSRLYDIWANMLNRCCNNFEHYEDTKVFIPWLLSFESFKAWAESNGYRDNLTIDRINKDGHYIPTNIQFITKEVNTAKSGLERTKGCSWDELAELHKVKPSYPTNPNKYEGSFKEHIISLYGEEAFRGIQARLTKYRDFLHLSGPDFIATKLPEGTKFKLTHYYIVKNGKAEFYRDYTGVAIDKDVLFAIHTTAETLCFNYYESGKYNIEMKWMPECTDEIAMKWPFMQAIIGDKVDNIAGIHGMGKVAAEKVFAGCQTSLECWEALVETYESKGKTQIDALLTIRLVHMHQFDGTKIVLWDPRNLV